ncbi:protein phosphatase 2C domain-containing protein [Oculatella sp. LEGE 06141]|uniref:protein phosphatase 2C domain-containing protein n=1 Tax=Oculatella sp. LEGE 06141 TaxID=1828648 RepID=UPI001D15261C|nr:protein phosphatase 2C domain-containing protein [Oculatella sp. LEGE 06141]
MPRHFLWAIGEGVTAFHPGDSLADRYLCKAPRIFLDTKPGLVPTISSGIPERFSAYLRLSPYQLHLPQIYDLLQTNSSGAKGDILLLDQAAVYSPDDFASYGIDLAQFDQAGEGADIRLLPTLLQTWSTATPLRQLNWLWQLAQLWQPLSSERVVSTLLEPELLRTEGPLLRVLELQADRPGKAAPSFPQLGHFWAELSTTASPEIASLLQQISQQLMQGQVKNAELLVYQLDEGLASIGRGRSRQIQIATRTDRGPSRQRNEDACYPPDGTLHTKTITANSSSESSTALVIVCDGIGGHQGGDVASNLAIEAVGQRVQPLHPETLDPVTLTVELENAVCIANDSISQRNDNEQRFDRQRMGTTLVMGLVRSYELYITHVGDSRAYWITRWGCRQVTQDDDVASREVRLGYSSYRQALQQPSSGSLVQALGMGSSKTLHPTVQRFILDEDGIFLLCSDGLSDNDRIEECWETEILPLLQGKTDLERVGQRLVEIANTRNGYDNVTVGIVYYQADTVAQSMAPIDSSTATAKTQLDSAVPTVLQSEQANVSAPVSDGAAVSPSTLKTQLVAPRAQTERKPSPFSLLLGILLLSGLGSLLIYFLVPAFSDRIDSLIGLNSEPISDPEPEPVELPSPAVSGTNGTIPSLSAGSFVRLSQADAQAGAGDDAVLVLRSQLEREPPTEATDPATATAGSLPPGSILQVMRQQTTQQERWVFLQVCTVPSAGAVAPTGSATSEGAGNPPVASSAESLSEADPAASPTFTKRLKQGQTGWIRESEILPLVLPAASVPTAQRGSCSVGNTAPEPTASPAGAVPSPANSPTTP